MIRGGGFLLHNFPLPLIARGVKRYLCVTPNGIPRFKKEIKMKQITKDLKRIKMQKALEKARAEYHSFMSVRELKDINSSYSLTKTMLRLEGRLVASALDFAKAMCVEKSKS